MLTRTLVLDLDGTLVDSVPDLAAALNRLMARHGLARFSDAEVTAMVGDGARALVDRAFAARGQVGTAAALADFLADYGTHAAVLTCLYPGVADGLHRLQAGGWRLAVCTNKPAGPARAVIAALGLGAVFSAIGGGDSYATRKPDPAHLLATIAEAGGDPGCSLMAGDHHNDVAAAQGAGIPAIFAAWGYGGLGMAAGAAGVAASFAELATMAEALLPAR